MEGCKLICHDKYSVLHAGGDKTLGEGESREQGYVEQVASEQHEI